MEWCNTLTVVCDSHLKLLSPSAVYVRGMRCKPRLVVDYYMIYYIVNNPYQGQPAG